MSQNYKKAGVDVEKADKLVNWLKNKPFVKSNTALESLGGFGALFSADFSSMKEPYLVSSADGVGTKLKIACQFQNYKGLGQDLVAMCLNDIICLGAEPLFFLDYFATSQLQLSQAQEFLQSVGEACQESGCAFIGGETAEMPGIYDSGVFDCAGFCVGVVDRAKILGSHKVQENDLILGISSSGFHSNGYSLINKLFENDLKEYQEILLRPTHLYVNLMKKIKSFEGLRAVAHITGGGLDNLLRVLPQGVFAELKKWRWPDIFLEAQKRGELSETEALKTFNCGIGLILIVSPELQKSLEVEVSKMNFEVFNLGFVRKNPDSKAYPVWRF